MFVTQANSMGEARTEMSICVGLLAQKSTPWETAILFDSKGNVFIEVRSDQLHTWKGFFLFLPPCRMSFSLYYFHSCTYLIPTDASGTSKLATI